MRGELSKNRDFFKLLGTVVFFQLVYLIGKKQNFLYCIVDIADPLDSRILPPHPAGACPLAGQAARERGRVRG